MTRIVLVVLAAVLGIVGPAAAQTPAVSGDWGRFSARGEYLLWWTKNSPTPVPLVTDGISAGSAVLLGGDNVDVGSRNGARLTLGYWFSEDRGWGLEVGGFYLPTVTERQSVSGSGAPGSKDLVIPFVDPTLPGPNVTNLSLAGSFSGAATEKLTSKLWGAEGNVLMALSSRGSWRVELLGGFRYLNLAEQYSFVTSSPDLPGGPATVFQTQDVFDATNDFYGGQLGLRARYQSSRWLADATLKVAVGAMHQSVDVAGSLLTNQFTAPTVRAFAGGYFAQPTNIGAHTRDVVAVVPEIGLNVGFRLTDWASIFVGGTFLYVSDVARPGNQVDRNINPSQSPSFGGPLPKNLVGQASPGFKFQGSDFWAYGLNVGLGLSF